MTFHVLAFDRKGGRWRRGDHAATAGLDDGGQRLHVERLLQQRLILSPGRFMVPVRPTGGGPEVTVAWDAPFRSAGIVRLHTGANPALACLLLSGFDEVTEDAICRSLQSELQIGPGHPLCPAFATVLRDHRRPLLATFRIGGPFDGNTERALLSVEAALASVYFGLHDVARPQPQAADAVQHRTAPQ